MISALWVNNRWSLARAPHLSASRLQERSELISSHKAELDALLEKRSALEQSFMEQYLQACEAYEGQLETMRRAEADEYVALKRRWAGWPASTGWILGTKGQMGQAPGVGQGRVQNVSVLACCPAKALGVRSVAVSRQC